MLCIDHIFCSQDRTRRAHCGGIGEPVHGRPRAAQTQGGDGGVLRDILDRIVKPSVGTSKADKLTRLQIGKLHSSLAERLSSQSHVGGVGSMYAFAVRAGIVPEDTNPARGIDKNLRLFLFTGCRKHSA